VTVNTTIKINQLIFNLHIDGGIKVHSTLRPLNGLLCQPRVIMIMGKSVEWLAGETEVLGENLPQCRFVHQNKPIELLSLVSFDSCPMFRPTFRTIFRQSHRILLLLINCPNMDPYYCYTSQPGGTRQRSWLRHYATSQKVAGASTGEVDFSVELILPAALWPGVDSTTNRNKNQEFSWGGKVRPVRRTDNLTAISEPIV
jgi:hypothetical protein